MRRETGGRVCYPEAKYFCDQCGRMLKSILDVVNIRGPGVWDTPDFCSFGCLRAWARGEEPTQSAPKFIIEDAPPKRPSLLKRIFGA